MDKRPFCKIDRICQVSSVANDAFGIRVSMARTFYRTLRLTWIHSNYPLF